MLRSICRFLLVLLCSEALLSSSPCQAMSMKRILVTGGNKGIGKAIVHRLLTEWPDTHVLLCSRSVERGQQAVDELIQELPACRDRLELLSMDANSDESVQQAAAQISNAPALYGIINNAGVMGRGGSMSMEEVVNTNYFGPRRVNDAFGKLLQRPGGRVVNIASASGPNFVSSLPVGNALTEKLTKPWLIEGGIAELDSIAKSIKGGDAYGASKALVNAYTVLYAKTNKDLIINSVTPGWIVSDMTQGLGASSPPSKGAVPPCWLMMDDELKTNPTGRYYGSDCVRSPLHFYRGPGEKPYLNDDDLVELPDSAFAK